MAAEHPERLGCEDLRLRRRKRACEAGLKGAAQRSAANSGVTGPKRGASSVLVPITL